MNIMVKLIISNINKLYKIYDDYAWNSNDKKIAVVFENNSLTFKVYRDSELMDEFQLSFKDNEKDLYKVIATNLFINMLGKVEIHKYNNEVYFNNVHKAYLLIMSKEPELNQIFDELMVRQKKENIANSSVVNNVNNKLKPRIYSRKLLRTLEDRIKISEVMFKGWYK